MELSSTTTVHEYYNLWFSKPSTSWHNTAFKPSSEPHHENVKRIHEDFVLENAVVNNIFAQDYKPFPEATEATSTSHPQLKLKTTQLNVLLNKWTPPPLGSSMASCRPPSLRCSAQNGMNNTQLSTRDRKLPQLFLQFQLSQQSSEDQKLLQLVTTSPLLRQGLHGGGDKRMFPFGTSHGYASLLQQRRHTRSVTVVSTRPHSCVTLLHLIYCFRTSVHTFSQ